MALNGCKDETKTQQTIDDFNKHLTDVHLKDAEAQGIVADHNEKGTCRAVKDGQSIFDLTAGGYSKYQELKVEVTAKTNQDAQEVLNVIGQLQDTIKTAVDKGLTTTIDTIKVVASKTKAVNAAVCAVENECNDNCNSKQLNILREKVKTADSKCWDTATGEGEIPEPAEGKKEFDVWISKICSNANALTEKVNRIKDMSVHIASINARLNFDGLKSVGEELKGDTKNLEEDTKKCIGFFEKEVKEACENLAKAKVEDSTAIFAERTAYISYNSLDQLREFTVGEGGEFELEDGEDWQSLKGQIKQLISCGTSSKGTGIGRVLSDTPPNRRTLPADSKEE
ncbi:MAG: hypothetical protein AAF806_10160 [Bacteroidota bacterium]